MNILAFFAHPDDETMLTGGTLALLAEHGANLHYLCATRGEGGEVGEPPVCTQAELGEVREQELVCAVQALGGVRSLTFLGYSDPLVGPGEELYPFSNDIATVAGQVATSIKQTEAQVILTHGSNGEYGHPAHILCFQAALTTVMAAAQTNGAPPPILYTVQASFPTHPKPRLANQDDPADIVIDVSSVVDKKVAAALCHTSQNALFVRRSSEDAGRPVEVHETVMTVESLRRQHPPRIAEQPLQDPLVELLMRSGQIK